MTKLFLICIIFCLSGCYEHECGARKAVAANKAEEKAIAHATSALESRCSNSKGFCDYLIDRDQDHISLRVSFKFPTNWGCEQAGDGFIDYVYDKNGNFLYASTDP